MDKKGTKIIGICIVCTIIIGILFIVALRLARPSCELIFVTPSQMRQTNFAKIKPIRSNDKSTLIKLSAYLEYNLNPSKERSSSSISSSSFDTTPASWTTPSEQAQTNKSAWDHSISNLNQSTGNANGSANFRPPVWPSNPQVPFTSQQLQNSSLAYLSKGEEKCDDTNEQRFLPLELNDVQIKKVDENKFKYTLTFNCSAMSLVLVRRLDRVYVQEMSLSELKPANRHKTSCQVHLPATGIFGADVHAGWARFHCDRAQKLPCYHYSSKHANQAGQLLAELHINQIEFETGTNSSNLKHFDHNFLGIKSGDCLA